MGFLKKKVKVSYNDGTDKHSVNLGKREPASHLKTN